MIPIGEPEVLSDSKFFKDLFEEPKLKLQHEFSELASQRDHAAFLKFGLDHASTGEKILLASMKDPGPSIYPIFLQQISLRRMLASQRPNSP